MNFRMVVFEQLINDGNKLFPPCTQFLLVLGRSYRRKQEQFHTSIIKNL